MAFFTMTPPPSARMSEFLVSSLRQKDWMAGGCLVWISPV